MGKYPYSEQWGSSDENNLLISKVWNNQNKVSWNNALEFCWRFLKTGKIYQHLPEAEWEYACRAGTTTPFYFGRDNYPGFEINYDVSLQFCTKRDFTCKQRMLKGVFGPNPFSFMMICTGLFGNGAAINGTIIL